MLNQHWVVSECKHRLLELEYSGTLHCRDKLRILHVYNDSTGDTVIVLVYSSSTSRSRLIIVIVCVLQGRVHIPYNVAE